MLIAIWEWTGLTIIILYTALRSVPRDVVESAVVDGAKLSRIVTRIKLPIIRPAIVLVVIINVIGALQLFTEPYLLTPMAPNVSVELHPYRSTCTNEAFSAQFYNFAAAIAVVLAFVIIVISGVFLVSQRRKGAVV